MRKAEYQHVSLRTEKRSDNGKPNYVLTWFPMPRHRMRKTFSDEGEAKFEADRIERLMANGYAGMTELPAPEMALFVMQCKQMHVQPHVVMQFYLSHHSANGSAGTVLVRDAGNAFVATRADQEKFSDRQHKSVKSHINRLIEAMGDQDIHRPTLEDLDRYIKVDVGGEPKTRWNHATTLISFGRWMRMKKKWFPLNTVCAFEELERPNVPKKRKVVYTPEELTRILVFTPIALLEWVVTGAFGGIRAAERLRLKGDHWQPDHGQFSLDAGITKTHKERIAGGSAGFPNLIGWMAGIDVGADESIVACRNPYDWTPKIAKASGVPWKHNALRYSFASYHLQKYKNPPLTALLDGHSVEELNTSYRGIKGVNDTTADTYASITRASVIEYARKHQLTNPEWA
jgi:hypothetical protein